MRARRARLAQVLINTNTSNKNTIKSNKRTKKRNKIVYKSRELEGEESAIGASHSQPIAAQRRPAGGGEK